MRDDGPAGDERPAQGVQTGGLSPSTASRRRFLQGAGVAGAAVAVGGLAASEAHADPVATALTADERGMVLRVARTGAAYPVPFPPFGEAGHPADRATAPRLASRLSGLAAERVAAVGGAARDLISDGLLTADRTALIDGVAARAAAADGPPLPLVALVALGIATISKRFDPRDDGPARLWLGGLREVRHRGQRPAPLRHRSVR